MKKVTLSEYKLGIINDIALAMREQVLDKDNNKDLLLSNINIILEMTEIHLTTNEGIA